MVGIQVTPRCSDSTASTLRIPQHHDPGASNIGPTTFPSPAQQSRWSTTPEPSTTSPGNPPRLPNVRKRVDYIISTIIRRIRYMCKRSAGGPSTQPHPGAGLHERAPEQRASPAKHLEHAGRVYRTGLDCQLRGHAPLRRWVLCSSPASLGIPPDGPGIQHARACGHGNSSSTSRVPGDTALRQQPRGSKHRDITLWGEPLCLIKAPFIYIDRTCPGGTSQAPHLPCALYIFLPLLPIFDIYHTIRALQPMCRFLLYIWPTAAGLVYSMYSNSRNTKFVYPHFESKKDPFASTKSPASTFILCQPAHCGAAPPDGPDGKPCPPDGFSIIQLYLFPHLIH